MIHTRFRIEILLAQIAHFFGCRKFFLVNNRTPQPFKHRRIRLSEKPQSLFQFPTRQVQIVRQNFFLRILLLVNFQIPIELVNINVTHIPIAVGRSKSPSAAAAFYREQNFYFVLVFKIWNLFLFNFFNHSLKPVPATVQVFFSISDIAENKLFSCLLNYAQK